MEPWLTYSHRFYSAIHYKTALPSKRIYDKIAMKLIPQKTRKTFGKAIPFHGFPNSISIETMRQWFIVRGNNLRIPISINYIKITK